MQDLFTAWLALPVPVIFAGLSAFYFASATLMVWLSFCSPLREQVRSLKGVVPPFFTSVAVIFGLLVAFLSNDIWDRNKQAQRVVLTEADTLVALYSLGVAGGSDSPALRAAIRGYASAVVEDEWPRLRLQERSSRTDAALDTLLRQVALPGTVKDAGIQRTMLEMVMRIRAAHEDRLVLASDRTAVTKWAAVMLLALITQIAIAVVHLDTPRPQAASLAIFTLAAVLLLGMLAIHEAPYEPPVFVPPGPIVDVLRQVPA